MVEPSYDKVRIGIGIAGWPFSEPNPQLLWDYAERMEYLNIDSIWFTDRIASPVFTLETVVAMSFIASRTTRLKFGTSVMALPLRNPTILAKELATIDFLSGGRCLPSVGLGGDDEAEYEACGTDKRVRVCRTEEAVHLIRRLWSEDNVTHNGNHFSLTNVTIHPKPVQKNLPPIWFGGRSEPALRRTAKLGDGWLPSQSTVTEIEVGVAKIKSLAIHYGNHIEEDHYGVLLNYCLAGTEAEAEKLSLPFLNNQRRDVPPHQINALGPPNVLIRMLEKYIGAGATKFVLRPACPKRMMLEQLNYLGSEIIPLFHK